MKTHWLIPSNLDLHSILSGNPPAFKYKVDHFYFIIDYLSRAMDFIDLKEGEFIPINAQYLQKYNKNYLQYLSPLVQQGVLITNNHYIVGKKSKGFRIASHYLGKPKREEIKGFTLKRSINNGIHAEKKAVNRKLKSYSYLTQWFNNKLKIDYNGAIQEVHNLFPAKKPGQGLSTVASRKSGGKKV